MDLSRMIKTKNAVFCTICRQGQSQLKQNNQFFNKKQEEFSNQIAA